MTTKPTLTEHRSPWVVFTSPVDPWLASETAALVQRNGLVLRLDGRGMRDAASVFRTFARDLSLPGYFGHNWDALVDCLHDWHGGDPAAAPWTAGPLSFADDDILSGMTIRGIQLFRERLGCSIHEALDILQSRSEYLRRERSDG
ncbi:barstar family protein [Streptomyces adustus]|uniref:barstar family protein n=1 Tax=Streptomyces adustus TaxID=1609272 RepID=UPI0037145EE9